MKCILAAILFLLPAAAVGQGVVIAPAKMNVVYAGIANPLQAIAKDCPCKQLVLTTDRGRIEPLACGQFSFHPDKPGGIAIIKAYCIRQGRDSVLAGEMAFRVKQIPKPVAEFSMLQPRGHQDCSRFNGIIVKLADFAFPTPFQVVSYNLTLFRENGQTVSEGGNTALFNERILSLLTTIVPGDRISVTEIIVIGPGNARQQLDPIENTIP